MKHEQYVYIISLLGNESDAMKHDSVLVIVE